MWTHKEVPNLISQFRNVLKIIKESNKMFSSVIKQGCPVETKYFAKFVGKNGNKSGGWQKQTNLLVEINFNYLQKSKNRLFSYFYGLILIHCPN